MLRRLFKDNTHEMDLDVGILKGLTFSPPREVDKPTYEVVGDIDRYDTRDHVFARFAMRPGTAAYDDYYSRHPEKTAIDDDMRRRADSSGRERLEKDRINEELAISGFYGAWGLSRPDMVMANIKMLVLAVGRIKMDRAEVDPVSMTQKIKALGLHLGAAKVRIAKLNQAWVYSHEPVPYYGEPIELDYPYVICLVFLQNPYMMATHTGLAENFEVGWTYSYASFISLMMANFIRHLGWRARPLPTLNSPYLVCPTFVDAGVGEDGRCGFVVSKEFGNNWRPGGVATDLPLVPDKPVDFGLRDFCDKCGLCAEMCPAGAISKGGREVVRGVRKWQIDADKCHRYWDTIGHSCGVCQAVCPWNHTNTWFHNSVRELASRFPRWRSAIIKGEELLYSHQPGPEPKWMTNSI